MWKWFIGLSILFNDKTCGLLTKAKVKGRADNLGKPSTCYERV